LNTEYEKPDLDFLMFDIVDVITTSDGGLNSPNNDPGADGDDDDGF